MVSVYYYTLCLNTPPPPCQKGARSVGSTRRRTIQRCEPTAPGRLPLVLSATGRLHAPLSQKSPATDRHAAHVSHRRVLCRTSRRETPANVLSMCVMLCAAERIWLVFQLKGLARTAAGRWAPLAPRYTPRKHLTLTRLLSPHTLALLT